MRPQRSWIAPALGLALAGLAACATLEPNSALERARLEVNAASLNPDVAARAPLELRNAQESLDRADAACRKREPLAEIEHHAYLAQVRARTAIDLARSRRVTDELALAQAEADRARLAAHSRDAQAEARRQALAAEAARGQAAAANRDAAAATREAALERERAARAEAEAQQARERMQRMETQVVEIQGRHTERGILVTLGDVLFEFDKAELLTAAQPRLDKLADFLRQFPDKKLLIEGYTDAIGSERYNLDLSQRRAEAVRAALVRRGVDQSRMTTEGYGKAYPVADNASQSGRQMNRRVEVVVADEAGNLKPRG